MLFKFPEEKPVIIFSYAISAPFINSFLEMNICDNINYIADNNLYAFDTSEQGVLYSHNQPDILNIYFVESNYS